ncbi:caspase b-like isoform X2 [Hoplias malabaricus]
MANQVRVQEVLLRALEDLNADELKRFQWHLVQGVLDGYPPLPKAKLEGVSVQETVNQLMQVYDDKDAMRVAEITLKRMNQNQLARILTEALVKGFIQHRVELNKGDDILP